MWGSPGKWSLAKTSPPFSGAGHDLVGNEEDAYRSQISRINRKYPSGGVAAAGPHHHRFGDERGDGLGPPSG